MYAIQTEGSILRGVVNLLEKEGVMLIQDWETTTRDQNIQQHIDLNDYFATTATVMDLMRQTLEAHPGDIEIEEQVAKHLAELRDEYMHLQEHYTLKKMG
jgi:hypothetical protein